MRHGDVRTYRREKCRCDPCRAANAADQRAYQEYRKALGVPNRMPIRKWRIDEAGAFERDRRADMLELFPDLLAIQRWRADMATTLLRFDCCPSELSERLDRIIEPFSWLRSRGWTLRRLTEETGYHTNALLRKSKAR